MERGSMIKAEKHDLQELRQEINLFNCV